MEHSLLKLKPELLASLRNCNKLSKSLSYTLYSQLDRAVKTEGLRVRAFDGLLNRDYRVIKYERTRVSR